MERMPVLGAELIILLYANACDLFHTFKDLHTWSRFSLRCDGAFSELRQGLWEAVIQIIFAVFLQLQQLSLTTYPMLIPVAA